MILRPTLRLIVFAIAVIATCSPTYGFQATGERILVTQNMRDLELVVGASQLLKFEYPIPKLLVQVPEVVDANAVATDEILISGLKPGLSTVTVVDSQGNTQTLAVSVKVDVRILQRAIDDVFPTSQVKVEALANKIMLSGYVSDSEQVDNIMEVAQDYFPSGVIGNMRVAKNPNVAIQVKIYEVSRTKLRSLGVDWAFFGPDFSAVSSFADVIQAFSTGPGGAATGGSQTFTAEVIGNNRRFNAFIEALEQHSVAKLLDEPTLVAKDGRPAEFLSGGEVPFQVASGLGNNSIEFRPFGTKIDILPIVLGRGNLTLEVRAEVSEVDASISTADAPGFRVRRVNTSVDMPVGHTLALAGDYREEVETVKRGAPKLMDHPFWGAAFRRTEETKTETELVFLLTPRFIDSVEASSVRPRPLGGSTSTASDRDLYINGHVEVPVCPGDGCPVNDAFRNQTGTPATGPVNVVQPQYRQPVPSSHSIVPSSHQPIPSTPSFVPNFGGNRKAPVRSRQASGFSWPTR